MYSCECKAEFSAAITQEMNVPRNIKIIVWYIENHIYLQLQ